MNFFKKKKLESNFNYFIKSTNEELGEIKRRLDKLEKEKLSPKEIGKEMIKNVFSTVKEEVEKKKNGEKK